MALQDNQEPICENANSIEVNVDQDEAHQNSIINANDNEIEKNE